MLVSVLEMVSIACIVYGACVFASYLNIIITQEAKNFFYYIHNKPVSKQTCKMRVSFFENVVVNCGWPRRPKDFNNPYPTAFPYGNGMVLHFYQQQESSTTKTVHKVINKGLKTYV